MPLFSFIIPVFNRPNEVEELLQSLTQQTVDSSMFEVIVVEDGSQITCKEVCERFSEQLNLHYYYKENSGPGQSRNYGADKSCGEYYIVLDSDVVLPETYMQHVLDEIKREPCDAFGGPDRAHHDFSPIQKAISYSMTSFFTTGGIRGGKKKLDKFYPRSYNMGIKSDVYKALNGFSKMRFGEDIDFSIRIFDNGYSCRLFPEAWVYHKRRTDFSKFFKQVYNSGIARINLYKKYPSSLKLVHLLPTVFTVGVFLLCLSALLLCSLVPLSLLLLYSILIFIDSATHYKSIKIGFLSVGAAFTQLMGYGLGFIEAWWKRCVRGLDEFQAFEKNFYK
ncbi:MAG: glycosyltransferase [Prevotella nanceiensis]|nr:glycosyltransferase [Hoylesella nanceiensis]